MEKYIIYLRKSQMDRDFDNVSVEDTLQRHKTVLTEFAEKMRYNVTDILEEVVSGESLSARPQMLKALDLINTGDYTGIICMDIDRLSRGTSVDSGYIMQALKYNNCKIITPAKTYDMDNDLDEQFTDLKFMFSRYELKTITKRLMQGRVTSSREGKYVGSKRPYGYDKVKLKGEKGFTLEVIPEEAEIVKMIYRWYIGGLGYRTIAYKLNQAAIPSCNGNAWGEISIHQMLDNEVYLGKIKYGKYRQRTQVANGSFQKIRKKEKEYDLYDGLHDSIITEDIWNEVKRIQNERFHPSLRADHSLKNTLAGLLRCEKCGSRLVRNVPSKKYKHTSDWYRCLKDNHNCLCDCMIIPCEDLEKQVIVELKKWFDNYIINLENNTNKENDTESLIAALNKRIADLHNQQDKICQLLEQGVYSVSMFQKRNSDIEVQLQSAEKSIEELKNTFPKDMIVIPSVQKLLDNYDDLTPEERNLLLKQVLKKITAYRSPEFKDTVSVTIYPLL